MPLAQVDRDADRVVDAEELDGRPQRVDFEVAMAASVQVRLDLRPQLGGDVFLEEIGKLVQHLLAVQLAHDAAPPAGIAPVTVMSVLRPRTAPPRRVLAHVVRGPAARFDAATRRWFSANFTLALPRSPSRIASRKRDGARWRQPPAAGAGPAQATSPEPDPGQRVEPFPEGDFEVVTRAGIEPATP